MRRRPSWAALLAWVLWALTLLCLPVLAWFDHLLRQAGRPELTWSQAGGVPFGVAAVSAATVGGCSPAAGPATRWAGCCSVWG